MEENMETREKDEITVSVTGGADIVSHKPEFSLDSKYLMCCSGNVVKVLSVKSGECVHTLKGHKDRVTCVKLNPTNPNQVLTSSLDKTVIKWDYLDGLTVKEYHVSHPVLHLYMPDLEGGKIFAILQKSAHVNDLVHFTLTKDNKVNYTKVCSVTGPPKHTAIGTQSSFIANVTKNRLRVEVIKSKESINYKFHEEKHKDISLTCVACHPTDQSIATGVSNGKILLWFNVLNEKKMVRSIIHWHSLPVECLAFTTEGSYLLSGGHECTLVKWQWTTHHKDFLPRLGSPIIHISGTRDNTHYALSHMENGIQVVSSNSQIVQIFTGLCQAHVGHLKLTQPASGLHLDPKTRGLVTNGRPGHLQIYDLHRDKQIGILDVTGQNYVSSDSLASLLAPTNVESVALGAGGDWLATVERWDNGDMPPEIRLKFWVYVPDTKGYKLNTLVELPHRQRVTSLKFRPSGKLTSDKLMAATASLDGYFKLWSLVDDTDIYRSAQCWSCESLGYYRERPPHALDFSEDGTLLAVGFDSTLTMWDPDPTTHRASFSLGNNDDKHNIRDVRFGCKECSHFVMVTTQSTLYVWNMLSCSVSWLVSLTSPVLVMPSASSNFAVLSGKELRVYSPSSPSPLYARPQASPSPLTTGVFIPRQRDNRDRPDTGALSWQRGEQLYFMNVKQELLTLNYVTEDDAPKQTTTILSQAIPPTPFSLLFSDKRLRGISDHGNQQTKVVSTVKGHFLKEMLMTPAHVMPPATSLAQSFMSSLMISSGNSSLSDDEESDDDDDPKSTGEQSADSEDSEMEVDEEKETETKKDQSDTKVALSAEDSVNDLTKLYDGVKQKSFKWLVE